MILALEIFGLVVLGGLVLLTAFSFIPMMVWAFRQAIDGWKEMLDGGKDV